MPNRDEGWWLLASQGNTWLTVHDCSLSFGMRKELSGPPRWLWDVIPAVVTSTPARVGWSGARSGARHQQSGKTGPKPWRFCGPHATFLTGFRSSPIFCIVGLHFIQGFRGGRILKKKKKRVWVPRRMVRQWTVVCNNLFGVMLTSLLQDALVLLLLFNVHPTSKLM